MPRRRPKAEPDVLRSDALACWDNEGGALGHRDPRAENEHLRRRILMLESTIIALASDGEPPPEPADSAAAETGEPGLS